MATQVPVTVPLDASGGTRANTPEDGDRRTLSITGNIKKYIKGLEVMTKYHNTKVKNSEGLVFDSRKEARRWAELQMMEASGLITNLSRQVKYVLIPAQREPDTVGKRGGTIKGKLVERECSYIADFVYTTAEGETIVEDVKGYKRGGAYAVFSIKRKLMLQLYNIRVKEV